MCSGYPVWEHRRDVCRYYYVAYQQLTSGCVRVSLLALPTLKNTVEELKVALALKVVQSN